MVTRFLSLAFGMVIATAAVAQVPPRVNDMQGAPPVTPMQWKHQWMAESNTSWDYVGRKDRPLVMNLPGAPSEGANGLDAYMWRLFHDDGYALGQLVWRDDRARTQSVREDIEQIRSQVAEVRADPARFGDFDPGRIVIVGSRSDAFPAALVAFDSGSRTSSPVCAAIFINGANLDPLSPETPTAKRRFSEDADLAQLLPARFAADAPPTLLLDEGLAVHSDKLAEAIHAAGGVAVQTTISMFIESDPRTYLGYSENPSTEVISAFLKTYCPAKDSDRPKP
jgi:hypothetical protein